MTPKAFHALFGRIGERAKAATIKVAVAGTSGDPDAFFNRALYEKFWHSTPEGSRAPPELPPFQKPSGGVRFGEHGRWQSTLGNQSAGGNFF